MLKNTIDKTRELTNNVKIVKNEINNSIVRGGVRSKDLKGIPQNIRNMVNQYSKIAIGNNASLSYNYDANNGAGGYTCNYNLDFTPKRIIARINDWNGNLKNFCIDSNSIAECSVNNYYPNEKIKIVGITQKRFELSCRPNGVKNISWIAIG